MNSKKLLKKDSDLTLSNIRIYFKTSTLYPLSKGYWFKPSVFRCKLCHKIIFKSISNIINSNSSSYGCNCNHNISNLVKKVSLFLESLNINVLYNEKLGKYRVDLFLPDYNQVIELNSVKDYKNSSSKKIENRKKYHYCKDKGYSFLLLYEDEVNLKAKWIILKRLFKYRFEGLKQTKVRPQKCLIMLVSNQQAIKFYNKFHIQGGCNAKFHIAVYYNANLVAMMSIRSPIRQFSGDWEIARMASDYRFKVHGIWSYLLKWVRNKLLLKGELVTFSDTRVFTGTVYKNMGMKKVNSIPQDYTYTKGLTRYNKSGLRKTKEEKKTGKTETELRTAQGYVKIWDLGKIKWQITL